MLRYSDYMSKGPHCCAFVPSLHEAFHNAVSSLVVFSVFSRYILICTCKLCENCHIEPVVMFYSYHGCIIGFY